MMGVISARGAGRIARLDGIARALPRLVDLVPWGVGGVALGYRAARRPLLIGSIYGFVLCFTFMLAGYTGKALVISRVPFFALIGLVGAVCGLLLACVGARLKLRRSRSAPAPSNTS